MPGQLSTPGTPVPYTSSAQPNAIPQLDNGGGLYTNHLYSTGLVATAAAGSNAGSAPPAPIVAANGYDTRGTLTCGTGGSAAAGNLVVVTFNVAYAIAPIVTITPLNAVSAALVPFVISVSTTGFTIGTQAVPTSSQANTVYAFAWHAIG